MNLKDKKLYIDTDKLTTNDYCAIIINDDIALNNFADHNKNTTDIDAESKILNRSINKMFNTKKGVLESVIVNFMAQIDLNIEMKEESKRYVIEVVK